MNYQETIEYLFKQLPMFQRKGPIAYKSGLGNSLRLDELYAHPHHRFKSVHIAGTNGKGSVSHMLTSVLQKAGYKTGLYTSPHLKDFIIPVPQDRIGEARQLARSLCQNVNLDEGDSETLAETNSP